MGSQPKHLQNATRPDTIETNAVVKNIGNTTSRQKAISAMCFQCMGCTETHREPGVMDDIRHCTAKKCALYVFRPYKKL